MLGFKHRLYLVTDEKACFNRDFFWVVEESLKGGVDIVQLREKLLPDDLFLVKAKKLTDLCNRYNVPVIINDRLEVAKALGSFGLHVGQCDTNIDCIHQAMGEEYPVGLSVELPEHLLLPQVEKAWYLGISPIFSTPTKTDTIAEWGLVGLEAIRAKTFKPLVAIGNIKISNVAQVIKRGADCIAVVSEICSAESPAKAAELLRNQIEKNI